MILYEESEIIEEPENETSEAGEAGEETPSEATQTIVVQEINVYDRPLMTTPFNDYTVTEGLLLIAVVLLAIVGSIKLFTGKGFKTGV